MSLIEWSPWRSSLDAQVTAPNDWYFLQVRLFAPAESVTVRYTETTFGPAFWPQVCVVPDAVEASATVSQTVEATLTVSDAGTKTLRFAVEVLAPWASCTPRTGTVAPGTSLPLLLSLHGASSGTHVGSLVVRTDDPASFEHVVPLTLVVGDPAVYDLSISVEGGVASLSWSPLPSAVGYRVYRAWSVRGPWELLATVTMPPCADPESSSLPHAFYRVTALLPDRAGADAPPLGPRGTLTPGGSRSPQEEGESR